MEDTPRFRFDSFTFFAGFGIGTFIGVALALLAIALVQHSDASDVTPQQENVIIFPAFPPPPPGATATPDIRPRTKTAQDVHVGPGPSFAVVGILARDEAVEVLGRSADSTWVAIRFPPGSLGRGWLPVDQLEGVSGLDALAVALPTPLPRNVPPILPAFPVNPNLGPVGPVLRTPTAGDSLVPDGPMTPAQNVGPVNLIMQRVALLPDGRIRVTVSNLGPGDLREQQVNVTVRDLNARSELMISPQRGLAVGEAITLTTAHFIIQNEVVTVQAIADPAGNINDPDRTNNALSVTLTPAPQPTPTSGISRRGDEN